MLTIRNQAGQTLPIVSGEPFDCAALLTDEPDDGKYSMIIQSENGETERVNLMVSHNIGSLFLRSADPAAEGRAWLEDCENHERSTTGNALMLRADGSIVYSGALQKIKGRGHFTWDCVVFNGSARNGDIKKPYQITLETKTDLLDTGDPAEANKRWVLLADFFDSTLLRNRIALDMALELGLYESSHCRPVDLYYDGEYRGTYLLAEKVEVGNGRVDIVDYEEILEKWNPRIESQPESLQQIISANSYGSAFTATKDILDAGETSFGGYLFELDNAFGKNGQAYFTLQDGSVISICNPEHASASMVKYVSELFEEFYTAISNEGNHPIDGTNLDQYLDMDSLLPYFWIYELSKNPDAWNYSSTYFVLPQQSTQIRMGPVWDFDLAFYTQILNDGSETGPTGLIETSMKNSIAYQLLCIPEFRELAARYYTDVFEPIVSQILLGDQSACGEYLHSLAWYWEEEAASRRMNDILWNPVSTHARIVAPDYEENFEILRSFIDQRAVWLDDEVIRWVTPVTIDTANIILYANYANAEATLLAVPDGKNSDQYYLAQTYTLAQEATETDFPLWRADIAVNPEIGYELSPDMALMINNTIIPYQKNEDGSLSASVWFEDISYRPAEYHGTDYGLVFDADYYSAHYPELAAALGNDPEALLAYYVEYGIAEGQQANAFFNPREVLDALPEVEMMLGDDFETIVLFFIEAGYVDWMSWLGRAYNPEILPAERPVSAQ